MDNQQSNSLNLAWNAYKMHLKQGGSVKKFLLFTFYFLSYINFLQRVPILGNYIKLSRNLFVAYRVEVDHGLVELHNDIEPEKKPFESRQIIPSQVYDYVIIGSGPGAATAARKLPMGCTIAVVERGIKSTTPPKLQHTLSHVMNDFSEAGQELILGNGFPQFAQGSTLGGGSEVNSGLYHKLPLPVKDRFLEECSLSKEIWDRSELRIERMLQPERTNLAAARSVIAQGAQALNLDFDNIPRWRKYSSESEFEHLGMLRAVWSDFLKHENFNFYLSTEARAIVQMSNGNLEIKLRDPSGEDISIFGRKLIVSAGTTGSARLLASSGFVAWKDTRFQWHPMFRSIVNCDPSSLGLKDIDPYQAWTQDYSLKFGSAVSTPGLLSLGLGKYLTTTETISLRSFYVSFVSSGYGGLLPGVKFPWYKRSQRDIELAESGKRMLSTLLHAVGTNFADSKNNISQTPSTVHIFGSLPINSGIYEKGTLRLKNYPNVFVCDGSILPFGPGVNPQAIIMSSVDALFKDFA